ncbi:PLDc N-terminal domain-containing protein [Candidatus Woesearchaeota archaeon]|nr:PLDc N-terminal domain-containing protein [Candidatus Woesearchaeota archaeon]
MALGTFLWLIGLVCMVWVIYDVFTKNKKLTTTLKVVWVICAIFFSIITAIVYYIMYKR